MSGTYKLLLERLVLQVGSSRSTTQLLLERILLLLNPLDVLEAVLREEL
jgi:hypothetical protein